MPRGPRGIAGVCGTNAARRRRHPGSPLGPRRRHSKAPVPGLWLGHRGAVADYLLKALLLQPMLEPMLVD